MLDYRERPKRITDSKLLEYLQQNFNFTNIGEFLQRTTTDQDEAIRSCKQVGGSIRQIVHFTGKPFAYVFKVRA